MKEKLPIAIEVKNLSKEYLISNHEKKSDINVPFRALNDVSFTLYKGDVVGIIGNNGSGKSTLLKILSKITKPTSGEAHFYGTVTSILDIGSNFHPDMSGRENVNIQLTIAKVHSNEFKSYHEKVKDFSEVGDFFDQPVKFYSSGMFLRLAFSIAFHLSSDIIILDEVLSVGDEGFRLKCQELLKLFTQKGKTILFVSHNRLEILELSNKCIWLEKGGIKKMGNPTEILSEYFAMHRDNFDAKKRILEIDELSEGSNEGVGRINLFWDEQSAPGNDVLAIRRLSITTTSNTDKIYTSSTIDIGFLIDKKQKDIHIGPFFFLQDVFYQPVLVGHFLNNTDHRNMSIDLKDESGLIEMKCTIPSNFLAPGKYYLLVRFGMEKNEWNNTSEEAFRFSEKLSFIVYPETNYVDLIGDISKGSVRPALHWTMQKL